MDCGGRAREKLKPGSWRCCHSNRILTYHAVDFLIFFSECYKREKQNQKKILNRKFPLDLASLYHRNILTRLQRKKVERKHEEISRCFLFVLF